MSIIRRERTENYTVIPNHIWSDEWVSFEAKSILAYLLSRPNHWKINTKQLKKKTGFGRDKIQKLIRELVERGYIQRETAKDEKGMFSGLDMVVYDEIPEHLPDNYREPENQAMDDQPEPENPCHGKSGPIVSTDSLVSTETPKPPKGTVDLSEGFNEFWKSFSDTRGKQAALRVWKRKKLHSFKSKVIAGANAYVDSRGNNKKYWKQAQGWLNDGRWEDFDAPDLATDCPSKAVQESDGNWRVVA